MTSIFGTLKHWILHQQVRYLFDLTISRYNKVKKRLSEEENDRVYHQLEQLRARLLDKDSTFTKEDYLGLKELLSTDLKKSRSENWIDGSTSILFILLFALCFRQMWVEHQNVPSGSMRPTLFEGDHLLVSKTAYGLNNPFSRVPIFFDSSLLQRGQIVTFTSEATSIPDQNIDYFGFLPGKRRLVKRLFAKEGDTIYFYGGQAHVVSEEGEKLPVLPEGYSFPISEQIPFHDFTGHLSADFEGNMPTYYFKFFGMPVAKLTTSQKGKRELELNLKQEFEHYYNIWGIENYAVSRLIPRDQLNYSAAYTGAVDRAPYYLELSHHPVFQEGDYTTSDPGSPIFLYRTLVPLSESHFEIIKNHLFTSRFVSKDQHVISYNMSLYREPKNVDTKIKGLEDGTYEICYGKAYKIDWLDRQIELPKDHLLNSRELTPMLYNVGHVWDKSFLLKRTKSPRLPQRYAYFREGDLYTNGVKVIDKNDLFMSEYLKREEWLASKSDYIPFLDTGTPSVEKILQMGLKVPKHFCIVLGDNPAGSADSRDWGFLPFKNMQGTPWLRFWPPSSVEKSMPEVARPFMTKYAVAIWVYFVVMGIAYFVIRNQRLKKPIDKE